MSRQNGDSLRIDFYALIVPPESSHLSDGEKHYLKNVYAAEYLRHYS